MKYCINQYRETIMTANTVVLPSWGRLLISIIATSITDPQGQLVVDVSSANVNLFP